MLLYIFSAATAPACALSVQTSHTTDPSGASAIPVSNVTTGIPFSAHVLSASVTEDVSQAASPNPTGLEAIAVLIMLTWSAISDSLFGPCGL